MEKRRLVHRSPLPLVNVASDMPTELFGALIDFKPPLSYIHPRRGAVTRLAKRGIEFLETPPLVAAIAATLGNGSKANPTQTLHQSGGRGGGEGLGNSHFFVLC